MWIMTMGLEHLQTLIPRAAPWPMPHWYSGTIAYYIFLVSLIVIINTENIWRLHRDFPGCPVVRTLHFQCRGCSFDPTSVEIRTHMICGGTRKIKKKKIYYIWRLNRTTYKNKLCFRDINVIKILNSILKKTSHIDNIFY